MSVFHEKEENGLQGAIKGRWTCSAPRGFSILIITKWFQWESVEKSNSSGGRVALYRSRTTRLDYLTSKFGWAGMVRIRGSVIKFHTIFLAKCILGHAVRVLRLLVKLQQFRFSFHQNDAWNIAHVHTIVLSNSNSSIVSIFNVKFIFKIVKIHKTVLCLLLKRRIVSNIRIFVFIYVAEIKTNPEERMLCVWDL